MVVEGIPDAVFEFNTKLSLSRYVGKTQNLERETQNAKCETQKR